MKDYEALILKAERPFEDEREESEELRKRFIGDLYLFKGPGTYKPRIEESVERKIQMVLVLPSTAIMIKAKRDLIDKSGVKHVAGEKVNFIMLYDRVVVT